MGFPDTGPGPDGQRTAEQWMNAMGEDVGILRSNLQQSLEEGLERAEIAKHVAIALKEVRRLTRDIERFGDEVHGLTQEDYDAVGSL